MLGEDERTTPRPSVVEKLEAVSRETGQRFVVVTAGGRAYTVNIPGPPGVVMLDCREDDLFARLEAEGSFDDPTVALTWVLHARTASADGIKLRQAGRLAEAYARQRLALFVVARARALPGVSAVV